MTDSVLAFVSQLLDPKCGISDSAEVVAAAKIFKNERAVVLARKLACVRKTLPGLDATQVLASQILHIISATFGNYFFVCDSLSERRRSGVLVRE